MAETVFSASSGASNAVCEVEKSLKRGSSDIGWEFGLLADPTNLDKLKCKLCGKVVSGGIYRIKQHIAHIKGNVAPCPKSSDDDKAKCKSALEEAKIKKRKKDRHKEEVKEEVQRIEVEGSRKKPHVLGHINKFASSIDVNSLMEGSKKMQQQNTNDVLWKQRTHIVHQYLAQWVYEACVPFHAIDNDSFEKFVEAVGQFGPDYRPPNQYQLREPLLKEEVEKTQKSLKKQEEEWSVNGCSILTTVWTDCKTKGVMNLCINCKEGTTFISSKETSKEAHTGKYIFEYVDKCIEDIGSQNVIQVVTDNVTNNMEAREMLKLKRPNVFWTSCSSYTLNLMLQEIGNQPKFKVIIEKAKALTIFIYAHHKTLALMRKFTKERDIVRPGVTKFVTSFLTLQSLMEKKNELKTMVISDAWDQCRHSKSKKGKAAYSTTLSMNFWNGVTVCLKVLAPLVKVFRLVEGNKKPSMGFLYGELQEAKEEIKGAFKYQEVNYHPILEIIDAKAHDTLDSPLHLGAYLLNPYYFFKDQSIQHDPLVMEGIFTCVEKFFPDDFEVQNIVINVELLKYKKKEGAFGRGMAEVGCAKNDDNYDPVGWWSIYGNSVPKLQRMAIKILSLTTSSSACEKNWNSFEEIHTKKMNKLDATRLNNLVYVQFNAKLINKRKMEIERGVDVLLVSEASKAQGWIVDGGDEGFEPELTCGMVGEASRTDDSVISGLEPKRSFRNVEVRELYEDDFVSDEDTEGDGDNENYEFDSDIERDLEGYGEELEG